jgi:hypothetical protein
MALSGVHTQYGGGLRPKQIDCFKKKKYIIIIHTLKVPKHFLSNNIHVAYFNISKVFSQSLNNILID